MELVKLTYPELGLTSSNHQIDLDCLKTCFFKFRKFLKMIKHHKSKLNVDHKKNRLKNLSELIQYFKIKLGRLELWIYF